MKYKQNTFDEIVESENQMILDAQIRYGHNYNHTMTAYNFLQECIVSVDVSKFIFTVFLGQIRKHQLLAILSTLRLHHTQAMMDLRQMLEAGASAAFALSNPNPESFVEKDENGILLPSQELRNKQYKWLDKNFPAGSKSIQLMKDQLNKTSSHANLVDAHRNYKFGEKEIQTPYFDFENFFHTKTALWQISNITLGLVDLLYGVNLKEGAITFIESFEEDLQKLLNDNQTIKNRILNEYPTRKKG